MELVKFTKEKLDDPTKYIFQINYIEFIPKTYKEIYDYYKGACAPYCDTDEEIEEMVNNHVYLIRKATEEDLNKDRSLPVKIVNYKQKE